VKSPTTNNRERTIASALAKADEYYTAEDYLRNEREADERHEYW
jgi:hypothetical protein